MKYLLKSNTVFSIVILLVIIIGTLASIFFNSLAIGILMTTIIIAITILSIELYIKFIID